MRSSTSPITIVLRAVAFLDRTASSSCDQEAGITEAWPSVLCQHTWPCDQGVGRGSARDLRRTTERCRIGSTSAMTTSSSGREHASDERKNGHTRKAMPFRDVARDPVMDANRRSVRGQVLSSRWTAEGRTSRSRYSGVRDNVMIRARDEATPWGVAVGASAHLDQVDTTTKTPTSTRRCSRPRSCRGVDIVRVAVPHWEDANAVQADRREVPRDGRRRHPSVEVRDGALEAGSTACG